MDLPACFAQLRQLRVGGRARNSRRHSKLLLSLRELCVLQSVRWVDTYKACSAHGTLARNSLGRGMWGLPTALAFEVRFVWLFCGPA